MPAAREGCESEGGGGNEDAGTRIRALGSSWYCFGTFGCWTNDPVQ